MKTRKIKCVAALLVLVLLTATAWAQTNEFTYQGKLSVSGTPSATYDFEFRLCASETECDAPLDTKQRLGVAVANGVFTVKLDFAAALFDGSDRWLEIAVKRPAENAFTTLLPRQAISSAPYATRSLNASNADQLGGLLPGQFLQFDGNGNVGIGAAPPANIRLDVSGNGRFITPNGNINIGTPNGEAGMTITGTNRADLRFNGSTLKLVAGAGTSPPPDTNGIIIDTTGNIGIGTTPGSSNRLAVLTSGGNTAIAGATSGNGNGVFGLNNSNGNGVYGFSQSGTGVLGSGIVFGVFASGFLGTSRLDTAGDVQLCFNSITRSISTCGSSLRYKKEFKAFNDGLSFINQLRPISYKWKTNDASDIGFGAEDVAKINPLFVIHNKEGQVEGIKYDRLSVVFVNAFKEQQLQIERQKTANLDLQSQVERQQREIEELKRGQAQLDELKQIVCSLKPVATVCKKENK